MKVDFIPKKSVSSETLRTKREVWNHHYQVVTRDSSGHIKDNHRWTQPMYFRDDEFGKYVYSVKVGNLKDKYGRPAMCFIGSDFKYNIPRGSYRRKLLYLAVKERYDDSDVDVDISQSKLIKTYDGKTVEIYF